MHAGVRAHCARPRMHAGVRALRADSDADSDLQQREACFGDRAAGCCGARPCEAVPGSEGAPLALSRRLVSAGGAQHTQFTLSLAPLAALRGAPTTQVRPCSHARATTGMPQAAHACRWRCY
jgi:hypothetical protein